MRRTGMNPDVVEQVSRELAAEAGRVDQVLREVQVLVDEAVGAWSGADADRFNSTWRGQHLGNLRAAAQMLHHMSQTASANAAEQRRVSDR